MPWPSNNQRGSTRRQRVQRAEILRRWPICYLAYEGCTKVSTEEEHVIPVHQGGDRWSYSNRRGACAHCHGIKTRAESAAARAARKRPARRHPGLI